MADRVNSCVCGCLVRKGLLRHHVIVENRYSIAYPVSSHGCCHLNRIVAASNTYNETRSMHKRIVQPMKRFVVALALILAILGTQVAVQPSAPAQAAPAAQVAASSMAHPAELFDKTRVVAHLAVAFGVFHRWVYKPFKAGDLSIHHPVTLVKAGASLLFAEHEVRKAYDIASHSNSATLKHATNGLKDIADKFLSIGTVFQKNPSSLTDKSITDSVGSLNSAVDNSSKMLNVSDAASALTNL